MGGPKKQNGTLAPLIKPFALLRDKRGKVFDLLLRVLSEEANLAFDGIRG